MSLGFVSRCGLFGFIWNCDACGREVNWPEDAAILVDESSPPEAVACVSVLPPEKSEHAPGYRMICVHRTDCRKRWQALQERPWTEYTDKPGLLEEFWKPLWLGKRLAEAARGRERRGRRPKGSSRKR